MNAIVEARPAPQTAMVTTPARLLEIAVQSGADLDRLSALMDLQERWQATEARKAWVAAMAAFKSQPIIVQKSKLVDFATSRGRTTYTHATLADVVEAAVSGMGQHGLSHRWDVRQEGGRVTVTCIVTHEMGHSESTSLTSGLDDSGNKNAIQQVGSAITYLQRYTLMSALGLAASDMQDDDGAGSQPPAPSATEEQRQQAADFRAAIEGAADQVELQHIGSDLARCGLPTELVANLRALYSQRQRALKAGA